MTSRSPAAPAEAGRALPCGADRAPGPGPRRRAPLLLLLALAACGRPESSAPAPETREPVEVQASVDRAVATTGDVITYRVTLDYEEGYELELPEPGAEIAGFRIIDAGREGPGRRGGRVTEERWYALRADLVGSYVLPPVTVRFRPADSAAGAGEEGVAAETVETSALFVEVESVLPAGGEAEDIRDLKPLRRIRGPVPWGRLALAALLLALLVGGLVLWLRRRRRAAAVPPVPPHELAFRALDQLRGTDFADPAAVRRFHFAISEVLRAYVEGRFSLNATDLTTEEILSRLQELSGLGDMEAERLRRFLLDTDRVKFAAHRPGESEIEATYERALGFVEATRRAEPEEEAAA